MTKYYRDSKGRFTTKGKAVKPKVVKGKVVKPKAVKPKVKIVKVDEKPTKRVYYRDSRGKFTTKAKAVKVQVVKPKVVKTEAEILEAEGIKTGSYKITKVIDDLGTPRYIVYSNKREWYKRLAKLKRDYGVSEVLGTKTHTYEPFLTPKAIKELLKLDISINA